jgi:hypothetical protein
MPEHLFAAFRTTGVKSSGFNRLVRLIGQLLGIARTEFGRRRADPASPLTGPPCSNSDPSPRGRPVLFNPVQVTPG